MPLFQRSSNSITNFVDHGAMTITATTSNPTKGGTIFFDMVRSRQVGDCRHYKYTFKQGSAGSGGTGDYLWTLPNSETFDTAKVYLYTGEVASAPAYVTEGLGSASITYSNSSQQCMGVVVPYDSTRFRILLLAVNSSNTGYRFWATSAETPLSGTTVSMTADFMAPITGLSA